MTSYDAKVAQATTDQGLDPVIARLKAEGIDHTLEQTGGFCMVVTVPLPSPKGAGETERYYLGITHDGEGFLVCYVIDDDHPDGGNMGESVLVEGADLDAVVATIREQIATPADQTFTLNTYGGPVPIADHQPRHIGDVRAFLLAYEAHPDTTPTSVVTPDDICVYTDPDEVMDVDTYFGLLFARCGTDSADPYALSMLPEYR